MFEIDWKILLAAYVLDFLVGDPRWLPHPIVWMGRAISYFEPVFRRFIKSELISGTFFSLFLISTVWISATLLIKVVNLIHPSVSAIIQTLLLFFCFSSRSLEKAAMHVFEALDKNDLTKARKRVGWIVGRETQNLDKDSVSRATIETVAENFVDGFLSPLFFALIGGVPAALAYKMVNTLDSMVGYKNDTYLFFGRAAARIDDVANFIPARFSVFVITLAAALVSWKRAGQAFVTGFREGRRHKSPNAGFPEAAFAGALQVKLGGPNIYHGKMVEKPYIGQNYSSRPNPAVIRQACDIMQAGAMVGIFISFFILFYFQHIV